MDGSETTRQPVRDARRVVLKIGTRVLTEDDGRVVRSRLCRIAEAAARLRRDGRDVLIVSSGAVGAGREALGLDRPPEELQERQACAAVGQGHLMALYQDALSGLGVVAGQVLLTQQDFDDRVRYLNLRGTLTTMIRRGVVPVINENDVVATEELAFDEGASRPVFGDNDTLSALVATKLEAALLVLLTDVDGVLDADPATGASARPIARVDDPDALSVAVGGPGSGAGRGGRRSKVIAAATAARGGCHAVIASGLREGALDRVLAGAPEGTWFPAQGRLDARRLWIGFATAPRGTLIVDAGAVHALRQRGASLLPAGVVDLDGDFGPGDVVEIRGPDGDVLGRGMVSCDAEAARRWMRGDRPHGVLNHHALVHRDHLVLEGTP